MTKKILIAMLLFFIGVYFMLTYYFGDVQINKYSDRDTVIQQKAIKRGWVPAILPKSAYNISETHDIDTNELFGSFYYKDEDEAELLSKIKLLPETNETYSWEGFLFKVDRERKYIRYRNKTTNIITGD
ncbi:hypothetical protein MNB_SV-6-17 [hydrothermal vent metagenome]|uniref:YbbD head domain-containing protein n=1 Tax=hydrothermal vent metagenome TaxID=652676 RepID=A0A1W1BHT9_9ZZZZ